MVPPAANKKKTKVQTANAPVAAAKAESKVGTGLDSGSNSYIKQSTDKYYKLVNIALTVLAFATRYYCISYPNEVVFDEVHFGKFAAYYIERTYFFDLHPPFAKLLIAAVGYLIGFNGKFKFDNIGDSYITNNVPYIPLRALSAVLGTLTVPLMFNTLKECGYSIPACAFAASLVLFDNAHIAETRLILLDATLIVSVAASLYAYVKFTKQRKDPFSYNWWKYLFLTGVSLSCVISTKYVGVFTFFTIGSAVLIDLWNLLDIERGLPLTEISKHFAARFFALIVVPFIIYLTWFYIHFAILTKSGPGDAFMTPEFQATLGDSPLAKEARQVNYHDIITFKHKDTGAFLHSHPYAYPLRYEDGRVSSQGQQVTGFIGDDDMNQWQILPVEPFPAGSEANHAVMQSDVVRFRHVSTGGYLLTHDVASPLYPTNEEFIVIAPEVGDADQFNNTLFKLDPVDKKKNVAVQTKASLIKLLHVQTVVAMWTHNDVLLPDWAFHQQEINGNKNIASSENIWYFDNIIGLEDSRKAYIPKAVKTMPFLKKWMELQQQMFEQNNKLSSEHPFASEPETWPLSLSGVSFWTKDPEKKQIYFIGNIIGWCIEVGLLLSYLGIVLADQLTRRRNFNILNDRARSRLYNTLGFFFVGWACHYFPFFLMNRQKFLHHYLPAHLIAALFAAAMLEFYFTDVRSDEFKDPSEKSAAGNDQNNISYSFLTGVIALLLSMVVWNYLFFAPITYGNVSLSPSEVIARQWFNVKLHFSK